MLTGLFAYLRLAVKNAVLGGVADALAEIDPDGKFCAELGDGVYIGDELVEGVRAEEFQVKLKEAWEILGAEIHKPVAIAPMAEAERIEEQREAVYAAWERNTNDENGSN